MNNINVNVFQMKSKPHGTERINEFIGVDGGENSFVAIGWPGIGDLTNVSKDEIRERLEKRYNYKGQQLGTYLSAVNTFVNTMKKDDIVLITNKLGHVFIFEVEGYWYDQDYDNDIGMCHQRKAKLLKVLNKLELNLEIQELLRNRGTITQFKYPFEKSGLDKWFEPSEELDVNVNKLVNSALNVLEKKLLAEDSLIRVKAAAEILRFAKEK